MGWLKEQQATPDHTANNPDVRQGVESSTGRETGEPLHRIREARIKMRRMERPSHANQESGVSTGLYSSFLLL